MKLTNLGPTSSRSILYNNGLNDFLNIILILLISQVNYLSVFLFSKALTKRKLEKEKYLGQENSSNVFFFFFSNSVWQKHSENAKHERRGHLPRSCTRVLASSIKKETSIKSIEFSQSILTTSKQSYLTKYNDIN